MATRIVVCYENQEHTLAFNKGSDATVVDRAISIACGIPWGSVTRLVDASGAVYAADPALFPDGKRLNLEVVATPQPFDMPAPLAPPCASPSPDQSIEPEPEQTLPLDVPGPLKVVVVGALGVGKTAYISRLKSKNPRKYKMAKEDHEFPTVGCEVTSIEMPTSRGTKKKPHSVTLKIWEIGGGEDNSGIRGTYYSGADAAIILFKAARKEGSPTKAPLQTYWDVLRWQNEVVRECGPDIPIFVAGVGADLEQKFPEERLEGTPCVKLSTKSGSNAYLPANFVLQAMSGDGTLRCKKDGSKTDLTPEQLDWHGIVEHITSTWKTWSVQ